MAFLVLVGGFGLMAAAWDRAPREKVAMVLTLDGLVGPATSDYVMQGLRYAAERKAAIVILQMDTPGGLDASMRTIIREILASSVPVASFVSPAGARAASAGTYILYASHVAAMTPGTNLGAATPVALGGGQQDRNDEDEAGRPRRAPSNAGEAKAVNDAVAYIRGLAGLRGRNADWAERAVREAQSLTATDAVRENVVDFTATDIGDLLAKAHGRTVRLGQADVELRTEGLAIDEVEPDWRTRLLSVITNPNVALILVLIGVYGLVFEFLSPGALVPGTVGGISLLTGLYALAVLPVTYAGACLLVLGAVLLVAEILTPTFGVLGVGGTIALVLGAGLLFDADMPGFELSWPMLTAIAVASLLMSLLIVRLALTSRRGKVVSGREQMIGSTAQVLSWIGGTGYVLTQGERWKAVSKTPVVVGQMVWIEDIDGLTLRIVPAASSPP